MRTKALKSRKPPTSERIKVLRRWSRGDECKFQFMVWADGMSLDVAGIQGGKPVFRPAICAWEAWKAAWKVRAHVNVEE